MILKYTVSSRITIGNISALEASAFLEKAKEKAKELGFNVKDVSEMASVVKTRRRLAFSVSKEFEVLSSGDVDIAILSARLSTVLKSEAPDAFSIESEN